MKYLLTCLLILVTYSFSTAQTLNGSVEDDKSGETLIGASVVVSGTQNGTSTNIDGEFEIKYTGEYPIKLDVSFIGYISKTVNAKDFMTYADKFPSEQIIDIRTAQEVKSTGTIASAINIDYNNSDDFKMKMNALDKNAAVMIYCQSGKRSAEAVKLMKMWGFKKIYEMEGGFKAYKTAFPKG